MKTERFIYNLNYPTYEKESCEIEVRSLFKFDLKEKVFFESKKVHPSISPFLKSRLEIIYKASTFLELIVNFHIISDWINHNKSDEKGSNNAKIVAC